MPSWEDFQPFIVTGLALGGVYALSGVGLVVLYRATGVLNLAFGAIGGFGALLAWELINNAGWPEYPAYGMCILFGAVVTLAYGLLFGPPLAGRDPLVKATATLGLALILLGAMSWIWSDKARSMVLPTSNENFQVGEVLVNYTQVLGLAFGVVVAVGTLLFLRYTKLGTAMRGLANDREITSLAAALIARLTSVVVTMVAGLVVGLATALATPILSISEYRDMAPFVLATIALLFLSRKGGLSLRGRAV